MRKTKIGVVGCGNICGIYFENTKTFDILEVKSCADIINERAIEKAAKYNIPYVVSVDEMLADPEIEIVLNLTPPAVHSLIALASLKAGKSVYNEKPLAIKRQDAQEMLRLAKEKGLLVGGSPDTFLGAGLQTCRKLIDEGAIGRPVAANANMMGHGPEKWHPDPDFFYQEGAGPLFDMGPYYLTALINMLGPVKQVGSMTRISFAQRVIGSEPKRGTIIDVHTPTHVVGLLDFENGVVGTLTTSFDVWKSNAPRLEIHGSEGSLCLPDPNTFGGPVLLGKAGAKEWEEIPLINWRSQNSRSLGIADMAYALRSGRAHRANGEMAYHVLDIMQTILDASQTGTYLPVQSTCKQPAPLPLGLPFNLLDE